MSVIDTQLTHYASFGKPLFAYRGMVMDCVLRNIPAMQSNELKRIRTERGLKQRQIAERLGVSEAQISRWENGKNNIPSSQLSDIATAYECTVPEIFAGGEPSIEYRISAENLKPLLSALIPLAPRGNLSEQSLSALAEALSYGLELLGEQISTPASPGELRMAARGIVSRFRDLGSA